MHLTWTTSDTIINNVNPEQCKYVISTYGMKQNVRIDPAYLQTLSKQTLIDEVMNAQNDMKQNHSNEGTKEKETPNRIPPASNGKKYKYVPTDHKYSAITTSIKYE